MTYSLEWLKSLIDLPSFSYNDEFSVDNFGTYFSGGAKAFLFMWEPGSPEGNKTLLDQDYKYLVRASKIPSSSIEEIVVELQQVNYKFGGKRTYDDWTISFNVDKDGALRTKFEKWIDMIHEIKSDGTLNHHYYKDYTSTQIFKMLDGNGDPILKIKLYNAWPKTIGDITLDYSSQDFAQFDVTFTYQYHEFEKIVTTDTGGSLMDSAMDTVTGAVGDAVNQVTDAAGAVVDVASAAIDNAGFFV
jgi:hypothetical protein